MMGSMRAWLLTLALGGCDYVFRVDHIDRPDARPLLADSNVPLDVGPCGGGTVVGGTGLYAYCVPPTALPMITIGAGLDTSVDATCIDRPIQNGTELCVIYAREIAMSGPVLARGSRPLVLIGVDRVVLDNNLNLAAHVIGDSGPGSDFDCASPSGGPNTGGGGGGAGGSFGTHGGNAGDGLGRGAMAPPAANGPGHVRGGCAGGNGGDGPMPNGGAGGHSGGAVYILSAQEITINQNINASGAAGAGGGKAGNAANGGGGGGGGGGSGGLIGLDAPIVTVAVGARLLANGGGGGSGGGGMLDGNNGIDPTPAQWLAPAPGGLATIDGGGKGGDGAASSSGGYAGLGSSSGGGGGGGEGYIMIYSSEPRPPLTTSPAFYFNGAP
jgi:hypothetical protein